MYELNLSFQLCNKLKKKKLNIMGILRQIKDQNFWSIINSSRNDIDGRFYTLTASRVIANIEHAKESLAMNFAYEISIKRFLERK